MRLLIAFTCWVGFLLWDVAANSGEMILYLGTKVARWLYESLPDKR
jgi:hypothetical protein